MSPRARVLLVVLLLIVAGVCVRLGVWQRDRLHQRRARNAAAAAARAAAPVVLGTGGTRTDNGRAERRIVASGRYDRGHEIVLRGLAYRGSPGVEVVTPLRIAGNDTAVLVNRGFVPAPDAIAAPLDSLDEPGDVTVRGLAQAIDSGAGRPITRNGRVTWRRLDLPALRGQLPYPVYPFVIRQTPDSALPSFPRRLDAPALDDGPHFNYMLQWFAFAITAAIFAAVIGLRKDRP